MKKFALLIPLALLCFSYYRGWHDGVYQQKIVFVWMFGFYCWPATTWLNRFTGRVVRRLALMRNPNYAKFKHDLVSVWTGR